jgi:hypothetical protein
MGLTASILKQIEQLGYLTAELNEGESRVIVAEPMVSIDPENRGPKRFRQMVRIDGTDEDSRYRAACQLALQCGIDLENG